VIGCLAFCKTCDGGKLCRVINYDIMSYAANLLKISDQSGPAVDVVACEI
jgi:hypothetical protein